MTNKSRLHQYPVPRLVWMEALNTRLRDIGEEEKGDG